MESDGWPQRQMQMNITPAAAHPLIDRALMPEDQNSTIYFSDDHKFQSLFYELSNQFFLMKKLEMSHIATVPSKSDNNWHPNESEKEHPRQECKYFYARIQRQMHQE